MGGSEGGSMTRLTAGEAAAFLYREARLLDEARFEEWQRLFTDDAKYWLPIQVDGEDPDPASAISIIYDDVARIDERVYRTLHTPVLDQSPRSRTVRIVSNVEVEEPAGGGDTDVRCNQMIGELRPGGRGQVGLNDQRVFLARCSYRFRRVDGEWRISLKKVSLLNADQPIYNLTFII